MALVSRVVLITGCSIAACVNGHACSQGYLFEESKREKISHHLNVARLELENYRHNKNNMAEKTCFDFVNRILQQNLPEHIWQQFCTTAQQVTESLDQSHQAATLIPYHYGLIAQQIVLQPMQYQQLFKAVIRPSQAQPGDIFIYIDPKYNPDVSKRKVDQPSGTHVGIIDHVVTNIDDDKIKLRIIDVSKRRMGRYLDPANPQRFLPFSYSIGYSDIILSNNNNHDDLYSCQIVGSGSYSKNIYIIRFCYPTVVV